MALDEGFPAVIARAVVPELAASPADPDLGRALYERATVPKRFVLVDGGSHCDTHELGHAQYCDALRELFGLPIS